MGHTDGLYTAAQRQVINQMLKLAASDDKTKILRAFRLAEKITPEKYKSSVRFVADKIRDDHPALLIAKHITSKLSPRCRDAFVECLMINEGMRGTDKRRAFAERRGLSVPTTIIVSPTMRCNLTCDRCYASEYDIKQDLDRSLMQKIVDEGNDMGVYFFTLLGGEPFMWGELLDFAEENKDSYFQVFTNGTLLDHGTITELARIGNIAPMLSLEGSPELTDRRRGDGVHDQVMEIMDHLGEAGVLFGYSCTVTRQNWKAIVSDDFVDPLIAKGALLAWHFLYMPVGRDPDTGMMLTAEERNQFRVDIHRIRDTKALFPVDFWGDAPWVNGCIAGKHYMHINSGGWVEPCIFTHFATDNIRDVSLLEAFNSNFFREIRARQRFNHNLLMPCMWIDNPESLAILRRTGARPTEPAVESMYDQLESDLELLLTEVARSPEPNRSRAGRSSDVTVASLVEQLESDVELFLREAAHAPEPKCGHETSISLSSGDEENHALVNTPTREERGMVACPPIDQQGAQATAILRELVTEPLPRLVEHLQEEYERRTRQPTRLRSLVALPALLAWHTQEDQDQLRAWVASGEVLALEAGRKRPELLFPRFQFRGAGVHVPPEVREVNRRLGVEEDPWGAYCWWVTPSGRLGGRAPVDAIEDSPSDVVSLARALDSDAGL